jgi:D-alanyl-D-alanine carboxypeptidase
MNPKPYTLLFALIFMSHSNVLHAQTFDPAYAAKLEATMNSIDNNPVMVGFSAAVHIPGQGTWTSVRGISKTGVPVTTDMRFGIGSNTKLFTAVALLKLQEQGVLSLDDPIGTWLPNYPYVDAEVTIRQLLTHQGGIFDFLNDNASIWGDSLWDDQNRFWTPEELLATIGSSEFEAGRGYDYSNTGYLLAGMVMESATGKSWALNVRELIFDPLGLDEIFAGAFETPNGPVCTEYRNGLQPILTTPMIAEYSMAHAAGALLSTGSDMVKWYNALFNGNFLTDASMREMLEFEPTTLYGLGINKQYFTLPPEPLVQVLSHSGGMVGFSSFSFFDPKTKISAFFVSNIRTGNYNPFNPFIISVYNNFPKQNADAGIVDVVQPWATVCGESVTPSVTLRNFGKDTLFNVVIKYGVEAGVLSTYNWTGTLKAATSTTVNLPAITVPSGQNQLICFTSLPNGEAEGYIFNDTARSSFLVTDVATSAFPLSEYFDALINFPPDGWSVNSNSLYAWGNSKLASTSGLHSAVKNNYSDFTLGAIQDLELPTLDCSNLTNATLTFNYAYTTYPGYYDSLRVQISEDCGANWQNLFYSGGAALRSAPETTRRFFPLWNQWKSKKLALNSTDSEVLLRFRSINGSGNNLFIDDIQVLEDGSVAVVEPETPGEFSLSPNPATLSISVDGLPDAVDFTILDVSGKPVLTGITSDDKTGINVGHLPAGFYVFQTSFGARKWVKI